MCIIDNNELLCELKLSHSNGGMTDKLIKLLYLLCDNITRHRIFCKLSDIDKEDLKQDAIEQILKSWTKFNIDKSSNAFGYFTKIIFRCYFKTLTKETRHNTWIVKMDLDLIIADYQNE